MKLAMKTKWNLKKIALLTDIVMLILVLIPISQSINAQKRDIDKDQITNNQKGNQPKVDIHVKKQKDQKGNIIGYDSTYTSIWSNNEKMPENIDSIFRSMQEHFSKSFSFDFNGSHFGFNSPITKDSLNNNIDPFNDMFGNNWADMDKMMKQQQKMMEEFFKKQQQPSLKVPDGVGKPAPKPKEYAKPKEEKKQEEVQPEEKQPETLKKEDHNRKTIDL